MRLKVLSTIQLITTKNYYFPNSDGNEGNDQNKD